MAGDDEKEVVDYRGYTGTQDFKLAYAATRGCLVSRSGNEALVDDCLQNAWVWLDRVNPDSRRTPAHWGASLYRAAQKHLWCAIGAEINESRNVEKYVEEMATREPQDE